MKSEEKLMSLVSVDGPAGARLARHEARHLDALLKEAEKAQRAGDLSLAEYFMRRSVAVSSYNETRARLYLRLGQLAEQQKNFADAVVSYGQGIALEPRDPRVAYFLSNNMGYSLVMERRYAAAESYCRAAIEVNRRRYNAHKNLGLSLGARGRHEEAARSLASAAILCPFDVRALGHLEEMLDSLEDPSGFDGQTLAMIGEARRVGPRAEDREEVPAGWSDSLVHIREKVVRYGGRPPVIAVVDDEENLIRVLSEEFRNEGFVAFGFPDKRRFFEELGSFPVDLVLTDLNSPGMRGMELLRSLKADRRWAGIPVLVVSGGLTLALAMEAHALGAADCIAKPYDYVDLLSRIESSLDTLRPLVER
jgi:CheY-like chemotaxis protein